MSAADKKGREYLRVVDAKGGVEVEVDHGFVCIAAGKHTIMSEGTNDSFYNLYIPCSQGRHYLSGQQEGDHLVGLYPIAKQQRTED